MRRLQSVLNGWLIFGLRRSDHISDALISLRWLRISERIKFKVAVLIYNVLHGRAPSYLGPPTFVADLPSCQDLRSSGTHRLVQPPVHRSTVGGRAFPVADSQLWNNLPLEMTSAPSLDIFHKRLKTYTCSRNHSRTYTCTDSVLLFYCLTVFIHCMIVVLVVCFT